MNVYARKVDTIQPACVAAWRDAGKEVVLTHKQGGGCPDCFLLHKGVWLAIEFKTGKEKLQKGAQQDLHQRVEDKGGVIYVIRSVEAALQLIGIWS